MKQHGGLDTGLLTSLCMFKLVHACAVPCALRTGDLFCNYHGWTFEGSGKCTSIPQMPDKGSPQVLGNPRACATSYPTRTAEGLIWVWGAAGPDAEAEAAAAPWKGLAPFIDTAGEGAFLSSHRWYFRDIPAGYVANKENSFNDPSHGKSANDLSLLNVLNTVLSVL